MSDLERDTETAKERLEAQLTTEIAKVKRSLGGRLGRGLAWGTAGLVLLLLLLFGAFAWYTTTQDFAERVRLAIVKVLGDATGGRVELRSISFNLWHLALKTDGLVIHGLEGPGEAPYLAADRVEVRVKLFNFFSHVAGTGFASHVSLNYLEVDHPQVHLIIDKNGKTNQPIPKHPSKSKEPVTDTLLDLKAKEVLVNNGLAMLNDRAIPFDLAARNLNAEVHYITSEDRYGATVDLSDLRTKMAKQVEAESTLHVEAELGRDLAELKTLHLSTGKSSSLEATGSIRHFAKPDWQATVRGNLELKQISVLANVDGLNAGTVDLDLNGHNCATTPAVAQKHPRFWQRSHPTQSSKPGEKTLPPDPDCVAGYLLVGTARVHRGAYRNEYVRLHDIDGGATLHVTPTELLLTALTGYLPGGGSAAGELKIMNWLGEAPPSRVAAGSAGTTAESTKRHTIPSEVGTKSPKEVKMSVPQLQPAHAYLTATIARIPLRTIMDVTAPEHYGDLGFDTAVSGPVKVEWGGPAKNIADTVEVDGNLTFAPTGVKRRGALNDVPVAGQTVAHYTGSNETVLIQTVSLHTPGTNLDASGILGVNVGDPLTKLQVNLSVRDLAEYNQLLTTLDLEGNGKKGRAAIPVDLHGTMLFQGSANGRIADLDVKGHLRATNAELVLGKTDVLIDSLVTDAEYSPNTGVIVASSTIKRGNAVLNLTGKVTPRRVVSRRGVVTYLWDGGLGVDAKVQLANSPLVDLLQIVGQKENIPVTGTIALNAHAVGTVANLNGDGHIRLENGVAYGEPYESAGANVTVKGKDVEASDVTVKLHGMQIAGNGGYDIGTENLHGHVEADKLILSKFATVQRSKVSVGGVLNFVADANGTLTRPGLKANFILANATYDGQGIGEASAVLHSEGETLYASVNSTLVGAKLNAVGQMQLINNYQMQAKLTLAGLDIGKPLAMFGPGSMRAESLINGVVTLGGPLKTPKALSGDAEFSQVDLKLEGVELKAAEPLRIGLRNGVATLEQMHVTGRDTDMRASGTAELLGTTDPNGGKLDVKATGSVSVALLHTFDPDILSSGKLEFTVSAGGRVANPALTGKIQLDDVNVAMDGVPNGLSKMNGTFVFNDDRLQVQRLTAKTGGGDLKIGGYIRYRNGVYADLTATGDVVRVRLYGLSATSNANLKLQGGTQGALLSGTILMTRFGIGPDVDFAAFGGSGGVSPTPDPNSAANKIRMDVHVTSAPQLDFQNSYAKLAGTVDLTIRGTAAVPSVLGRIEINDGSATYAGTKYQLQRGDIYFANPVRIDPTIDLDATAQVENYDITVGLHGTATNLKPTFRSEPPLSEADVFALLALGRTQEEAQLYQERQVQQGTDPTTSALLGGALNATVSNRVEKLFGVGSVKIDPAFVGTLGSSSARITVHQQISKQITATFATNVNTSAQQLIQVQYDFNHDNALVVTRDESGVYSVVYKLRKRYR